ncbi:PLP-dependent aminotransferase family protein [Martelella alba]|uniref:PLP-dependent aminotransferase family protein n=1 Tax=Martelella alba TaxID=2590451 RepID=A0A506UCU2_9HYPH|nr:PLP-dependent aminotransferase family protein [Martelella alba]TPW30941.1 PLP-dependent aminotransferase family protein [Martelella alba]
MTSWKPNPRLIRRPAYLSLAEQISGAIRDGLLINGMRLPPQRQMAADLKISVQTVSRAYEELTRRGLLTGEVGRGSYVRAQSREPEQLHMYERNGDLVDLSILKPVCESRSLAKFSAAFSALGADMPPELAFSMMPNALFNRYRLVGANWLAACGLKAPPQCITVTNGASEGITAAMMGVAPPGSVVAAEELTHPMLKPLSSYLGFDLEPLPMDEEGLIPEALDQAAGRKRLRAVFVQPSVAGPYAALMSAPRRRAITAIARRRDFAIIENDVLGPLIENRQPPLAAFAPERTLYITDFSKNTIPGLRTGFLAAPPRYAAAVANRHLATNWIATPAIAEIASRWIVDGTAMELINWQRMALKRRHGIAAAALRGVDYRTSPGALHLWLPLPSGMREEAFVQAARARGVIVAPGSTFHVGRLPMEHAAVRISLSATTELDLTSSLGMLASMLRERTNARKAMA